MPTVFRAPFIRSFHYRLFLAQINKKQHSIAAATTANMYSRLFWSSRSRATQKWLLPVPILVGASMTEDRYCMHPSSPFQSRRSLTQGSNEDNKNNNNDKKEKKKDDIFFDITNKWNGAQKDLWNSVIFTNDDSKKKQDSGETKDYGNKSLQQDEDDDNVTFPEKVKSFLADLPLFASPDDKKMSEKDAVGDSSSENSAGSFKDMAATFASVLAGGGSAESIQKVVQQARESAEEGDIADKKSLEEVLAVLKQYADDLLTTADKFLGDVTLTQLYPTSLFYFVEAEDSRKNPSWKRRVHRFYPGIDIDRLFELNDYSKIAELSYADTVEEIQKGLENSKTPYELVYVDLKSEPNRPAHFVALQRSQNVWSSSLEVLMCVRGTKSITDAIADLLCDEQDYRGGKAHSGVLKGGLQLAKKHKKLFESLLKSSGKKKIKLKLVGHSLGAGAASIVGMELNDDPKFDVQVIGFGCPALLSKELSEQTKSYITTIVADDDCVPRMSAASVVNALLDIMEYDYTPFARRDVNQALSELQRLYPMIVTKGLSESVIHFIDPLINKYLKEAIKEPTSKRMEPVLFPPGTVIHFYRDGVGVTGSVTPCDFFNELAISRRMVDDHLFQTGYHQIFLELMRQQYQDHNFQFDNHAGR